MNYFLCRLNPPRPTFALDMSDDERQLMQRHSAYWKELLDRGKAVVFGPVGDPAGVWGMVVVVADNRAEAETLASKDPVIVSNRSFSYDVLPMLSAVVRA